MAALRRLGGGAARPRRRALRVDVDEGGRRARSGAHGRSGAVLRRDALLRGAEPAGPARRCRVLQHAARPVAGRCRPRRARHVCLDLGEEEFTRGRPHPMIDPEARLEQLRGGRRTTPRRRHPGRRRARPRRPRRPRRRMLSAACARSRRTAAPRSSPTCSARTPTRRVCAEQRAAPPRRRAASSLPPRPGPPWPPRPSPPRSVDSWPVPAVTDQTRRTGTASGAECGREWGPRPESPS